LLCCAALLPTPGFGATYQVKQDGSADFTAIQTAIEAANDGDELVAHPGTYYENIRFDGKNITLRSLDPEDEEIVASTIIDGGQNGSVVTFRGTEDETCLLSGFTIMNGSTEYGGEGGGITGGQPEADPRVCALAAIINCTIKGNATYDAGGLCSCNGTISNCTISGNTADDKGGGLRYCLGLISDCTITGNAAYEAGGLANCYGLIRNCTISDNSTNGDGGGLHQCYATVTDCIIWGNDAPNGGDLWDCGSATITYSCVGVWFGGGEGNISDDPLFVSGPLADYYLSCRAAGQDADSPCIDTGSGTAESLGLAGPTTRTDGVPDAGTVDMGYHYPLTLGQNPQIECSLNSGEFAPGDLLVGFIEAQNGGADVAVDVYVAFVLPNGTIISLAAGALTIGIHPWVSNVVLPSGYHFGPSEVFRMTVPDCPGSYLFAAALTEPGQFEFIGEPSLFPFTIRE